MNESSLIVYSDHFLYMLLMLCLSHCLLP